MSPRDINNMEKKLDLLSSKREKEEKKEKEARRDNQKQLPELDQGRQIKWEYVIPIVATPAAHIFVTLIRKYPQHKTKMMWGVAISTFLTLQTRFILMYDAGYPGAENKVDQKGLPAFLKFFLF
jgi:hypothetical protein